MAICSSSGMVRMARMTSASSMFCSASQRSSCSSSASEHWRAAAIVRLDVHDVWRGRGLGSYLLDRALTGMAAAGHARVEVQTRVTKHQRA